MSEDLAIWTVYDHPTDHPEFFIARKSLVTAKGAVMTDETLHSISLETLQSEMRHRGLRRMAPHPSDDPVIVEVWM